MPQTRSSAAQGMASGILLIADRAVPEVHVRKNMLGVELVGPVPIA